jgi:hypothetical protein
MPPPGAPSPRRKALTNLSWPPAEPDHHELLVGRLRFTLGEISRVLRSDVDLLVRAQHLIAKLGTVGASDPHVIIAAGIWLADATTALQPTTLPPHDAEDAVQDVIAATETAVAASEAMAASKVAEDNETTSTSAQAVLLADAKKAPPP